MKLPAARTFLIVMLAGFVAGTSIPSYASSSYKEDLARGVRQMEKKDFESAVASFTEVLRDNPNVYEAYLNRAASRVEIKDYEGALSDYDQAIKINPNVVESYLKRADLNVKQNDLAAAVADYSQALRLNPKDISAHIKRAEAYKLSGDYTKASEDYSAALKLDANAMEPIEQRADCLTRAYDLDGAIADYNFLLKKFKTRSQHLHYNLGEVLLLKGDKPGANAEFEQAIAYYSKNIKASKRQGVDFLQRGLCYSKIGMTDKAISDLESAVAMSPGDASSRAMLGHLRLAKGDSKGALKDLDEAVKINPKLASALMDRAEAYIAEGQFSSAQKDLDQAIACEKNAEALLSRAIARLALGDSSGAAADAQEAKNLNPKSVDHRKQLISQTIATKESEKDLALAQSMEQLALLELTDNNPDSAESLMKKSIEIDEKHLSKNDPKLAFGLMMLGRVQLKKHQPLKAEALFRSAMLRLKNNPDGAQKYAVFNLEDCARMLIQSSSMEEAGAILVDTRMARAVSSLSERAFTGDVSRKAERAIEAYKLKKKNEQQQAEVATKSVETTTESSSNNSNAMRPSTQAPPAMTTARGKRVDSPIRDKWALIVGISSFKDSDINLRFCAKDAKDFYDFLIKEKDFAPDHVQLLTDSAATRANILSLLGNKWLPRVAEPDDLVLIYFSSHGSPSNLDVGGVNYLVAYDTDPNDLYATAIAMQDLTSVIKERVHSDRVMLILDACHSGAVAPSAKGIGRAANVNVDNIVQGTGQLVLSSSSPEQQSWESKRYQGSVFTKHLIDGLRRNGKMTRLGEAFTYLNDEVQREVLRDRGTLQNPVMKSKWEGKELIIGVTPSSPSPGVTDIDLPDAVKSTNASAADAKHKAASKDKGKKDHAKAPSAKHAK